MTSCFEMSWSESLVQVLELHGIGDSVNGDRPCLFESCVAVQRTPSVGLYHGTH